MSWSRDEHVWRRLSRNSDPLDELLDHEGEVDWRPSGSFLMGLEARLDEVDASLAEENERIPQVGARREESVLFSLEALQALPDPEPRVEGDDAECSSVFFLPPPQQWRRSSGGAPRVIRRLATLVAAILFPNR